MDQTNPLSEITHKRRLNAMGPGGLTRERAGFEVRDVHYTHYGRICPIETPEGPNIGLITSMAVYTRVNSMGFLETPYRVVENGRVLDKIIYLSANEEDEYIIAQSDAKVDENGYFTEKLISCRHRGEFPLKKPEEIQLMDISPLQIVSVSTSLIPFLEHDDANRALMGSNMQRQAVPLLKPEIPLVGTGMEPIVARDSGYALMTEHSGVVIKVDAEKIYVKRDKDGEIDEYHLNKFHISNQNTSFSQRPCVSVYHAPRRGKIIKLSKEKMILKAEDGKEFHFQMKVGEHRMHPFVKEGDVVEEGELLAGEKVIGKDKAKSHRNATVLADGPAMKDGRLALGRNLLVAFMPWRGYNFEDAIIISQRLVKEDIYTSIYLEEFEIQARETKLGKEMITRDLTHLSEKAFRDLDEEGIIRIGAEVKAGDILVGMVTPKGEADLSPEYRLLYSIFGEKARNVKDNSLRVPHGKGGVVIGVDRFRREDGHDLPPGVLEWVKVYVAQKRKIQVGDKMAGRHGNKGVIAAIVPEEDMPFLDDGTPVDIILNPLGVPSRMNIGQLFETQLGWIGKVLGYKFISPIFQGASIEEMQELAKKAQLPLNSKVKLRDGRTGEYFEESVFVGYIYMLKLHHMVEDKVHARCTGPYSLVTQQPLGGKAQFGGQRLGEMEVWALEAYGASYTLQEMLTVKSDDIEGRTRIYEAIIKGIHAMKPGIPESFNVLLQEMRALALDVEVLNEKGEVMEVTKYSTPRKRERIKIDTLRNV